MTLDGGGATSQAKAQGIWRANYQDDSGNTVNYEEVGSGTGRENFNSGAYSFAGSDSYMNDDEGELSAAKEQCGSDPIEVPAYVSPIAVAFNVPGVDSLNLSAETIANIFNGTITKWDDDAIAADNADADLPSTAIAIIHRSDDSGTTTNFTDYLFKASNGAWATEADGLWPEDLSTGQGLEGTSGVIGGITDTEGAIGYADDSAVKDTDLGVVSIGVGDAFNAPTAEGAAMVVATSPRAEGRPDVDMAIDIDRTITDDGRLPAAAHVVPDRLPDLRRRGHRRRGQGLPGLRRLDRRPAGGRRRGRLGAARLLAAGGSRRDRRQDRGVLTDQPRGAAVRMSGPPHRCT